MNHRGWRENSFGYFERGDTAPESDDPLSNVMLAPDLSSMSGKARPDLWTFKDRTWLDDLLNEVQRGFESALFELFTVWAIPEQQPGQIPYEDQPGVFLTVPTARALAGQHPPVIYMFASKLAVKDFIKTFESNGVGLTYSLRSLRPTRLLGIGDVYLLGYDFSVFGDAATVNFIGRVNGRAQVTASLVVRPERIDNSDQTQIQIKWPGALPGMVYVLDGAVNPPLSKQEG